MTARPVRLVLLWTGVVATAAAATTAAVVAWRAGLGQEHAAHDLGGAGPHRAGGLDLAGVDLAQRGLDEAGEEGDGRDRQRDDRGGRADRRAGDEPGHRRHEHEQHDEGHRPAHVDEGADDAVDHALRPQAVVVNNDPEVAVFLSRKLRGVRVVHWFHNLEMSSDRFRRRFAADRGIRSVAVSAYLARAVEQVYQLTPLTVTAALNGVAADRFGTERTSPLVTVGYVGRLAVEKAPDTLVAACIRVAERGARFRLLSERLMGCRPMIPAGHTMTPGKRGK